jgi:ubiquitin-activating enzyme E1 C
LTGFKDIHVIDLDTIDVSNLNRQFLFRQKDVGSSKAKVAARVIMERIPGYPFLLTSKVFPLFWSHSRCEVTPYFGKIQDKDASYYEQFAIIVCGLDSVEARRWINAKVHEMYDPEDPATLIPIVDGGTEGEEQSLDIEFAPESL